VKKPSSKLYNFPFIKATSGGILSSTGNDFEIQEFIIQAQ
jgi:hypothetical protein